MKKKTLLSIFMAVTLLVFTACGNDDADFTDDDDDTLMDDSDDDFTDWSDEDSDDISSDDEDASLDDEDSSNDTQTPSSSSESSSKNSFLDDNSIYFFTIDGETYTAGESMSKIADAGYELHTVDSQELESGESASCGIGFYSEEVMRVPQFYVNTYNPASSPIKYGEGNISGLTLWGSSATDETIHATEVYGGIHIGSTREEVEAVFGVPARVLDEAHYTFRSSDSDRYYKFMFDDNDQVSKINWINTVYDK